MFNLGKIFFLYIFCNTYAKHGVKSKSHEVDVSEFVQRAIPERANLDLSVDAEYEDLRAELLAYKHALKSIHSSRRTLITTPCWKLGGICVHNTLCPTNLYLSQVHGCRNKENVCCLTNNKYYIRDFKDKDIKSVGLPWGIQYEFGGLGVQNKFSFPKPQKAKIPKKLSKKPKLKEDVSFKDDGKSIETYW